VKEAIVLSLPDNGLGLLVICSFVASVVAKFVRFGLRVCQLLTTLHSHV
jgi:hypothetical protein